MSRIAILMVTLTAIVGCGGHLTTTTAERSIIANSLIDQKSDGVKVEAISQASGSPEAVVRAVIAGTRLNLRMRRFDKGWSWEGVETKAGGWVSPDVAMAELRETQRRQGAARWASDHTSKYSASARAVSIYVDSLPSATMLGIREGFSKMREFSLTWAKTGNWTEAERRERIKMYSEPAIDAWGQEVLIVFRESDRTATFISTGPDRRQGTADDIVCVAVGQRVWSPLDERTIWEYRKTWRVPEYLDKAVAPYVESGDQVELSRVQ